MEESAKEVQKKCQRSTKEVPRKCRGSAQGASCKEVVKHHTRLRHKIQNLDGKSDCYFDETQSAKTLCPENSKAEYLMEENKFNVWRLWIHNRRRALFGEAPWNLHNQFVDCDLALPYISSLEIYRKESIVRRGAESGLQ